jgi:aminopyrrolnitrin oxygenase
MIPDCPGSWYLACLAADLKAGQVKALTIGERELVLFRDWDGAAHALAAHCVHMGCHLKHGSVIEDRLRCPLHFRQFDGAGRCRAVPGGKADAAPGQPTFPLHEQFGALFVFVGRGPAGPFPTPHDLPPEAYATLVMAPFSFPLPWYGLIANGCDLDHLQTVHLRRLKEPPTVGPLPQHRFQVRYRTRVIGHRLADRVMRWLSGDDIRAAITVFGGSLMLVESTIKSRRSFLLLSMRPVDGGTGIRCVVGLPGGRSAVLNYLSVRLSAWLFLSFLKRDVNILKGQRLHRPAHLATDGDRYVSQLFDYFEALDEPALSLIEPEAVNQ